jgi:glycosidase
MPTIVNVLERRVTHFILWRPLAIITPPVLIIGQLNPGNPPTFVPIGQQPFTLQPVSGADGLWQIAAADCQLTEGQIYHYWFGVEDSRSNAKPPPRVSVTDPFAFTADWRLFPPDTTENKQPAAVIKFEDGKLVPCDPGGETASFLNEPRLDTLPPNNQMVIYELPTAWSMSRTLNEYSLSVGTFRDSQALVDEAAAGANLAGLTLLEKGNAHLVNLGVNAIELLPPADSFFKREWGYGTAHFLAPDYDLGYPEGNASPTANSDLVSFVEACHKKHIRVFADTVMAFGHEAAWEEIDFADFHIADPAKHPQDEDAKTSGRGSGNQDIRNGFGSTLFRYTKEVDSPTYDPISGELKKLVPARQFMFTHLIRWMRDFHIDGIRIDSVENVANWDFISGFKDLARQLYRQRFIDEKLDAAKADERFLVVGEELSLPFDILKQQRLDALWNDTFHSFVRAAILGQNANGEPSFEWTLRKAIDCRVIGFSDGAQAVNYITSHDVEGFRRERLFTMLRNTPDAEKRIKLAFVCLLTAVGIPMILAGEEFADQHDIFDQDGHVTQSGGKQIDPVNFGRLTDNPLGNDDDSKKARVLAEMRRRIFTYVSRLVKFRTSQPALSVNETDFIHVDFNDGKRVLVWKRGAADQDPVVVVANFSDFVTANAGSSGAVYQVNNWPDTPLGRVWREVTQDRLVAPEFVSREPVFPWEAKVYTLA